MTFSERQSLGKQAVEGLFYHRTNKECPVITAGFSTPIRSRMVEAQGRPRPPIAWICKTRHRRLEFVQLYITDLQSHTIKKVKLLF
jgi:hypothetical protein